MNKLRKVGLTALATTLVASSAYAGEMSVSGSASLNYSGISTNSATNPWTMGDSVTFSGGGGAVTIGGNSDIRLSNGNWTGNAYGKIQHHSNYLKGLIRTPVGVLGFRQILHYK